MSCAPTGSPSLLPTGRLSAGSPASEIAQTKMSARYIETGSSVFSPARNAGVGVVGVSRRSTPEAKARLLPALSPGNVDKTKQAPVTAIIGYDTRFFEWMASKLFAHRPDMAENYAKNPALTQIVAFRNATLQGAYFMLAARAVGLDVGGMSGFDNARVDAEFFPDGRVKSNFLCNLGHGDPSKVMAKLPRLDFDEACTLL